MKPLLETVDVVKYFPVGRTFFTKAKSFVRAVDHVSLTVDENETSALVGESGCGKTTLGRLILRTLEPTSGQILFEGIDITKLEGRELKDMRKRIQMIFQDPMASLNPRKTVAKAVGQPLQYNGLTDKTELHSRVSQLLDSVGLIPELFAYRFPHELSGGQRQRVVIARAVALHPKFIVADEPVSALDVSIRAQILNLMKELGDRLGLSYLLVTHDLAVARFMSAKVFVMYLGEIVETTRTEELFNNPLHPYTRALLSASSIPDPKATRGRERVILKGDVPSPIEVPTGCRFRARCPKAFAKCGDRPILKETRPGHYVACFLHD
jgi:oligopeptide/dipeptide ABC transporter ATP-binding protein